MIRPLTIVLLSCIALSSCGTTGGEKTPEDQPFGPTGIPRELRGKGPGGNAVTPGGNVTMENMEAAITPEENLVFTDPDNPDASIPELSTLLSGPKKSVWEDSEVIARRRASREGKSLLIYFSDSKNPMCKVLESELFSKTEFGSWAEEKLVRLQVDLNKSVEMENLTSQQIEKIDTKNSAIEMKKRFKVLGHPTLLLLNPSGEVIGRYRGYKRGDAEFTWGLLKHGESVSSAAYQSWRKDLEKKGYRGWEDTKGRKVFAKLVKYHDGELFLIEPDGLRSKTKESRLSDTDRAWIKQQKMLRGIKE